MVNLIFVLTIVLFLNLFQVHLDPDYSDVPCIDWNNFQPWANSKGWNVQTAPEKTHQEQQSTPQIRFTKIDQTHKADNLDANIALNRSAVKIWVYFQASRAAPG